ncbi:MAG: ornithine carbamoyltransferase [Anaerolineae bacterium]
MRHFLSLLDYSRDELIHLLDRADALRDLWLLHTMPQCLDGQQVGLWFYGQGFRNRLAFEIGAKAMGGQVSYVPGELGVHEPLEDVGHYLANWYDLLVVRTARHEDLYTLAASTPVPVINARTNSSHPCEIMGDLQFIRQRRGSLDGLKMVFVGEVTNLCMSWFEAAVRFPIHIIQVAPDGYQAADAVLRRMNDGALGEIAVSADLDAALTGVDLIYTDCWPKVNDTLSKDRIRELFLPYQITAAHVARLHEAAMFLPCPPVTRGEEVSAEAMQSRLCLNYAAKDNLLHAQNAIMELLAGGG